MERSLVRPTNYNELGLFRGIRESIASECRELVRICHSILNRYISLRHSNNISHLRLSFSAFSFAFSLLSSHHPITPSKHLLNRNRRHNNVSVGPTIHTTSIFRIPFSKFTINHPFMEILYKKEKISYTISA